MELREHSQKQGLKKLSLEDMKKSVAIKTTETYVSWKFEGKVALRC